MARWYIYEIVWKYGIPPLQKNLDIANRRLRKEDPDVPLLTAEGFVESYREHDGEVDLHSRRWRNPSLDAEDVFRILQESNTRPRDVQRWICVCKNWNDCDEELHECRFSKAYCSENDRQNHCNHFDEDYHRFYASHETDVGRKRRYPRSQPFQNSIKRNSRSCLANRFRNRKLNRA